MLSSSFSNRSWLFSLVALHLALVVLSDLDIDETSRHPKLSGHHFRVTVVQEGAFLEITEPHDTDDGTHQFGARGYLTDVFKTLADRANFTYELLTPSGFGDGCQPQLFATSSEEAYGARYYKQYHCGTNDVNQMQGTNFSSDMYLGMFFITPERQKLNYFTTPFQPPFKGTLAMLGTATGIRNIKDLEHQQSQGKQPPACMLGSTASLDFIKSSYPDLQITPFYGTEEDMYNSIVDESCPIHIFDAPIMAQFTLRLSQSGKCLANGKPIGLIGEPMRFGLSHYSIGVGKHLNYTVVETFSYWINVLMVEGTLAEYYRGQGGTGKECGYVLFPHDGNENRLSDGAIAGVAMSAVAFAMFLAYFWHRYRMKLQEQRYKKRFVQQIARNIEIGRRPGSISPEKLAEQILHIGEGKDVINKKDLSRWMHDIKMDFISEKDFDALWNAIDIDGSGEVDAVEFIVFLSACGPEFERVYEEQEKMSKLERLKLAARRLTNLKRLGEEGVRRIEHNLDRRSRNMLPVRSSDLSSAEDFQSGDIDRTVNQVETHPSTM